MTTETLQCLHVGPYARCVLTRGHRGNWHEYLRPSYQKHTDTTRLKFLEVMKEIWQRSESDTWTLEEINDWVKEWKEER